MAGFFCMSVCTFLPKRNKILLHIFHLSNRLGLREIFHLKTQCAVSSQCFCHSLLPSTCKNWEVNSKEDDCGLLIQCGICPNNKSSCFVVVYVRVQQIELSMREKDICHQKSRFIYVGMRQISDLVLPTSSDKWDLK